MPVLSVGKTDINYRITRSQVARRKRIIVTPNDVEVVVPAESGETEIHEFVYNKRRWVYEKREGMNEWLSCFATEGYLKLQSGAKVPYRGRNMRVRIKREACESTSVSYQNGFLIQIPQRVEESEVEGLAGINLTFWLKDRIKADIRLMAQHYANLLGLKYESIQIADMKHMWGSCTQSGRVKINWHLVAAPKAVLEYVVLHEICHLKHRNHSDEFWALVAMHMPAYTSAERWLRTHFPEYKL